MKAISILIDVILCLGLFLVFNESESLTPNFVGLACFVALLIKHRNDTKTETE